MQTITATEAQVLREHWPGTVQVVLSDSPRYSTTGSGLAAKIVSMIQNDEIATAADLISKLRSAYAAEPSHHLDRDLPTVTSDIRNGSDKAQIQAEVRKMATDAGYIVLRENFPPGGQHHLTASGRRRDANGNPTQ